MYKLLSSIALCIVFISSALATTSFQDEVIKLNCVLSAEIEPMLHTQSRFESVVKRESYLLTVKTKKESRKENLDDCVLAIEKKFSHYKVVEKSKLSNWLVVESY